MITSTDADDAPEPITATSGAGGNGRKPPGIIAPAGDDEPKYGSTETESADSEVIEFTDNATDFT